MPSGIGKSYGRYPSMGKHLSEGSDYPDSPCGSGSDLVYRIEDVTCPACLSIIIERGKQAGKQLKSLGGPKKNCRTCGKTLRDARDKWYGECDGCQREAEAKAFWEREIYD